jgi:SAM-dependent methyltransferase
MAHEAQVVFASSVKHSFPEYFKNIKVFDGGSLDINGNNRYLFEDYEYVGVDIGEGKNVDVVSTIHEYEGKDGEFDFVISSECFEHDMHYDKSLLNMVRMLKPGGMMLFTCATDGRPEHGTRRTSPTDSPFTSAGHGDQSWSDYYMNVNEGHVRSVLDCDEIFEKYEFHRNFWPADLYFWGIKKK